MISIIDPSGLSRCRGFSRRQFLRVGSLGCAGLTLPRVVTDLTAARQPSFIRDKSVVFLFLQGGPPQIEMFNPTMQAASDIRSCTGEVATTLPGVTFGGTFPKLAARADRVAIVRSYASGTGAHEDLHSLTGNSPSQSSMGAQYARLAGPLRAHSAMPTHSVILPEQIQPELKLGQPSSVFSHSFIRQHYPAPGDLGASYRGLFLDGSKGFLGDMELKLPSRRFEDRRLLLSQLDALKEKLSRTSDLTGSLAVESQAYEVLIKGIADAFDLTKEDPGTIDRYDTSGFFRMEDWHRGGKHYNGLMNQSRITNLLGKQMLLARRLCEAGCGFVTVVDCCWDFHGDSNNPPTPTGMSLLGHQADHAITAFLDDLEQRGLSDKILLVVTAEIGRTPRKEANGGTGHWSQLTPLLLAGGGLNMGQVVGTTDRYGGRPATRPYGPEHLRTTIMQTLFDPSEARLVPELPREILHAITESDPIQELV